jgi:hypothetical protein
VAEAMRSAQDLLDWARASGHPWVEAIALAGTARLHAMTGAFDEARRILATSLEIYHALGRPFSRAVDAERWVGTVEWLAGNPAAAAEAYRRGRDELLRLGAIGTAGYMSGELSRMLYLQNRFAEAFEATEEVERLRSNLPPWTGRWSGGWRGVRALILAHRGQTAPALELARKDVDQAAISQSVWALPVALEGLADVLELAHRPGDVTPVLEQALDIYQRKGMTVFAARVRERLRSSSTDPA